MWRHWPLIIIRTVPEHQRCSIGSSELQECVTELQTRLSIGSGVEVDAHVPDTSKVFISTALGYWAECTLEEAPQAIATQVQTRMGHEVRVSVPSMLRVPCSHKQA